MPTETFLQMDLEARRRRGQPERTLRLVARLARTTGIASRHTDHPALLGPGAVNSILAIGIFNIPVFARISRASGNAVWSREYVLAARAAGKGGFRITVEHVLPNVISPIVVQATISFAIAILAEAALSYLGLGTQPPHPSWGRMLNDAQTFMFNAPYLAIFPGAAIVVSVLGLNLLGDGMRDLLDPRLTRGR